MSLASTASMNEVETITDDEVLTLLDDEEFDWVYPDNYPDSVSEYSCSDAYSDYSSVTFSDSQEENIIPIDAE